MCSKTNPHTKSVRTVFTTSQRFIFVVLSHNTQLKVKHLPVNTARVFHICVSLFREQDPPCVIFCVCLWLPELVTPCSHLCLCSKKGDVQCWVLNSINYYSYLNNMIMLSLSCFLASFSWKNAQCMAMEGLPMHSVTLHTTIIMGHLCRIKS